MSMTRSSLTDALQSMLCDAADKFKPVDLERHLDLAALDLVRVRPRTLAATLTLVPGQHSYPAPEGFVTPKFSDWGHEQRRLFRPWDKNYPLHLPRIGAIEVGGVLNIHLQPAPTAAQISCIGSSYYYFYYAAHTLSDDAAKTTVQPADKHLLLLRAAIYAMTELANGGTVKPVQLHKGMGSQSKSTTASMWVERLTRMYEAIA